MASIRKHVTKEMVSLEGSTSAREAARVMAEKKIGSVAVKEGGKIVGLVTERDLVATVLANGNDVTKPISAAMRPGIPRISVDAQEGEAADMMRDNFTRHLLVEEGGKVVGVVSMRDVIQLMLDEKQFLISQLNTYIFGR
jgi:signal-transduction protein with cAMP-binding, CBS, and nucleotidyltransferase domain